MWLSAQDCGCNLGNNNGLPSWKNGEHWENSFSGIFYRFFKAGSVHKEGCWLISEETFRNLPKNWEGKPCPEEVQNLLALMDCPDHYVRIVVAQPEDMYEGTAASWVEYGYPQHGGARQFCARHWLPKEYFDHGEISSISSEGCTN
jgi:hypothetical protein